MKDPLYTQVAYTTSDGASAVAWIEKRLAKKNAPIRIDTRAGQTLATITETYGTKPYSQIRFAAESIRGLGSI